MATLKQSMLMKELVRKRCLVRKESAFAALANVDCVLLKIPWGGESAYAGSIADGVQKFRAMGISSMLCFHGSEAEATVVAEQLLGTTSGATVVNCPSGEDWQSVVSHVANGANGANGATVSILAEIPTKRIAQAVQALQEAGRIVLYYGFADEEVDAIAAAAVGFAGPSTSEAVKSASAVITLSDDMGNLIAGVEACRSPAFRGCCTVQ